ncbi:hypothetical protein [Pseudarthrobacter sp. YAF2]|uniref:hypothetical protein n=1 Tax=Pseudarthrobacter sp. YAF2 TaxID=3233078 RepID=UPI003F9B73C8
MSLICRQPHEKLLCSRGNAFAGESQHRLVYVIETHARVEVQLSAALLDQEQIRPVPIRFSLRGQPIDQNRGSSAGQETGTLRPQ